MMSKVSDSTTHDIIRGALAAWGTLDISTFLPVEAPAGTCDIHDSSGRMIASVRQSASPIGPAWHVRIGDKRERVFPSVVTTLRYLRGYICPAREAGRVMFGQSESL